MTFSEFDRIYRIEWMFATDTLGRTRTIFSGSLRLENQPNKLNQSNKPNEFFSLIFALSELPIFPASALRTSLQPFAPRPSFPPSTEDLLSPVLSVSSVVNHFLSV